MVILRKLISISFFQFSISAIVIFAAIIAARISTRISAINFLDFGPYYSLLFMKVLLFIFIHRDSDLDVFEISCIVSHAKRIIATGKFCLWFLNLLIHQKFSFFENFQVNNCFIREG